MGVTRPSRRRIPDTGSRTPDPGHRTTASGGSRFGSRCRIQVAMTVNRYLPALIIASVGTTLFYFIGQINRVDFSFAYNSLVFAFLLFAATYRIQEKGRITDTGYRIPVYVLAVSTRPSRKPPRVSRISRGCDSGRLVNAMWATSRRERASSSVRSMKPPDLTISITSVTVPSV